METHTGFWASIASVMYSDTDAMQLKIIPNAWNAVKYFGTMVVD